MVYCVTFSRDWQGFFLGLSFGISIKADLIGKTRKLRNLDKLFDYGFIYMLIKCVLSILTEVDVWKTN